MSLLRLRLEVADTAIMREIAVPEDFTLAFLHTAIHSVFAWLVGAFRKCPEAVLHEPDALEIFLRIYRLVHLVGVAEGYVRPAYPHEAYWQCMEN